MMPIARRLLEAKNDARMTGLKPVKAHISKRDAEELENWVTQQNRQNSLGSVNTGLPVQTLSAKKLWGMDIVVDDKVKNVVILEMEKQRLAR